MTAQSFYFGADLSYVNEMEDCGVAYQEDQSIKDPYEIFQEYGCNLVRLRLWHTPSWYDNLNDGKRYSDFADIKRAITRAKEQNMEILLDFHLSNNWADPSKQLVPNAWLPVVDNTTLLGDSLYNYIYQTLENLHEANLLPEMIQVGNETNKGILLSPEDDAVWTLDWERNAYLFKKALQAVSDFEQSSEAEVKTVIHVAGAEHAPWLIENFIANGVTDFDIIGLSYYWAWHKPDDISTVGELIDNFKNLYPSKEILVVETGYIWTNDSNDTANNIINETHPDFQPVNPVNPVNQKAWLIALAKQIKNSGGIGMIYWEPCWVTSSCFTQWGQGSHQEHASFFDFDNNLLEDGGIGWMNHDYSISTNVNSYEGTNQMEIKINVRAGFIEIIQTSERLHEFDYKIFNIDGKELIQSKSAERNTIIYLRDLPPGNYNLTGFIDNSPIFAKTFTCIK